MAQDITIDTSAYADGAILTEAKLDTVFGNVETAIENVLNGSQAFDSILLNATAEPVTISAGAVTVTRAYAALTSQTGTSDDLDTLTLTDGKFAFLRAASGHTITLKHGTGNIKALTNGDVVLVGDDNDTVLVFSDGSQIGIIGDAGSGGGSIGGSTGATDNRILRADGTGGATVQSSAVSIDDSGVMTGVSVDASLITYTPTTLTDWDGDADPGDVDNALDQLAERVDDLEGAGGGATVVTANKVHKFGANQTTTSGTMTDVDATNAAITATLTGSGKCLVIFSFSWNKGTGGSAYYRITDGTNHSNEVECVFASTGPGPITLSHVFNTSAGSTTYKLQFRSSDANTAQILATVAMSMSLMEVA